MHDYDLDELTAELGERFDILTVELKAYAANGSIHTAIEAAWLLLEAHHVRLEEVDRITVSTSTLTYEHTNAVYRPESVTYAQFCIPYCVAAMLAEGDMFVDQCTEEKIADPALIDVAGRVEVRSSPEIDALGAYGQRRARVEVRLRNGRVHDADVEHRPGSPSNPLTTEQITNKFMRLATHVVTEGRARRIAQMVMELDTLRDVAALAVESPGSAPSGAAD